MFPDRRGRRNANWRGGKFLICPICKEAFWACPYELKAGRKFCSRKCSDKGQIRTGFRIPKEILIANNKKRRVPRVKRTCPVCRETFYVMPHYIRRGQGKFCSIRCSIVYRNALGSGRKTGIEKKVEHYLKKLKISYEYGRIIHEGKTIVDFYIPAQRVVIYCDGKYWHSKPEAQQRDATQDLLLRMNAYKVIRLSERNINNGKFRRNLKKEVMLNVGE